MKLAACLLLVPLFATSVYAEGNQNGEVKKPKSPITGVEKVGNQKGKKKHPRRHHHKKHPRRHAHKNF